MEQRDFNLKLEKHKSVVKKIDVYKEIMAWLVADLEMPRKQRHTGKRVFDRLKEKYGKDLPISFRSVQAFVSEIKKRFTTEKGRSSCATIKHTRSSASGFWGSRF